MIEVTINRNNSIISSVTICGHANSNEHGKDLVCAGVSSCCVGVLNTLVHYDFLEKSKGLLEMKDGYVNIEVHKSDKEVQVILETLVISLETLKESNQKYIRIKNMEV